MNICMVWSVSVYVRRFEACRCEKRLFLLDSESRGSEEGPRNDVVFKAKSPTSSGTWA